ncbi:MAG: DUF3142 domain-containing protein [Deltaproteobacteria bacterium]|nr:DUF3142 domain-containing protein [Deltaproteobacteria bacterium]
MGTKHALIIAVLLLANLVGASRCPGAERSGTPTEWKVGYWLWSGWDPPKRKESEEAVDLLYVHVGTFWSPAADLGGYSARRVYPWGMLSGQGSKQSAEDSEAVRLVDDTRWPAQLPDAEAYIAVWRNTSALTPGTALVPALLVKYRELKRQATQAGRRLVGLQIDHDCPTDSLSEYARFLQELRAAMPPEDLLSITALLDWFRSGTRIADVLQWVNEYVPQFYDVDPPWTGGDPIPIAKAIDSSRWAAIFNSYGRSYRVGIAIFGRIVRATPQPSHQWERAYFRDLSPLNLAGRRDLNLIAELHNEAGETVVRYKTQSEINLGDYPLAPGTIIEMILPTQDSVRSAYLAAKALGGLAAGVVFFRWPAGDYETLVLTPNEVQDIISGKRLAARPPQLEVEDGHCAVVGCTNVYVRLGDRFPTQPVTLWLHTSSELEYILPAEHLRATVQGPHTAEIGIPSYAGVPRLYVGRVVTRERAQFTLGSEP